MVCSPVAALSQSTDHTQTQIPAAIKYVDANEAPIDDADFDRSCGVGKYSSSGYIKLE